MNAAATKASRLRRLGADARSIASIAAALSLVVMGIVFLLSYRGLPERTEQNHKDILAVRVSLESMQSDMRDLKTASATQLCLTIAEKQHTDWRACFVTAGSPSIFPPTPKVP